MKHTKQLLALLITVLACLATLAPATAHAAPTDPTTITIVDNTTPGGDAAVYTLTKVATIDPVTGAQTPLTGGPTVTVTAGAGAVTLDKYAVYEVVNTTRADGYLLDTRTGQIETPVLNADGSLATSQAITIEPKLTEVLGTLRLTKTGVAIDGTSAPLAGATFDLVRVTNAAGATVNETVATGLVTGADGVISSANLTEGTYQFVETGSPAPYAVDTTPRQATVAVDAAGTAVVTTDATATNYEAPFSDGAATLGGATNVIKAADRATATAGEVVQFAITVAVPQDIASYTSFVVTDVVPAGFENVTVDSAPQFPSYAVAGNTVTLTGDPAAMTPGTYTVLVSATVAASTPEGTTLSNTADVSYDNGRGAVATATTNAALVTVEAGTLTFTKVDGTTNAPLAGATFGLFNTDGTALTRADGTPFTATSDANGVVSFTNVPAGSYQALETAAPAGYRLSATPVDFTIAGATPDATAANFANYAQTTAGLFPLTGTLGPWPFLLAGGLLFVLFLVTRRKRAEDEQVEA